MSIFVQFCNDARPCHDTVILSQLQATSTSLEVFVMKLISKINFLLHHYFRDNPTLNDKHVMK